MPGRLCLRPLLRGPGLSAGSLREPPRRISCGAAGTAGGVPRAFGWPLGAGGVREMRRGAGAERPCAQPRSASPPAVPRVRVHCGNPISPERRCAAHSLAERHKTAIRSDGWSTGWATRVGIGGRKGLGHDWMHGARILCASNGLLLIRSAGNGPVIVPIANVRNELCSVRAGRRSWHGSVPACWGRRMIPDGTATNAGPRRASEPHIL